MNENAKQLRNIWGVTRKEVARGRHTQNDPRSPSYPSLMLLVTDVHQRSEKVLLVPMLNIYLWFTHAAIDAIIQQFHTQLLTVSGGGAVVGFANSIPARSRTV